MTDNEKHSERGTIAHRLATITALIGTGALAVASFVLSFTALTDLVSERSPIPDSLAWLWAVSLDGLIVVSTVALVALARRRRRERAWAAFLLLAGVALSTAGNVAHAVITGYGLTGALISALPPVLLASITHLSVALMRAPVSADAGLSVSAQPYREVSAHETASLLEAFQKADGEQRAQDEEDVSVAYERTLAALNADDERERAETMSAQVSGERERTPIGEEHDDGERGASVRDERESMSATHERTPTPTTTGSDEEVLAFLQEVLSEGREPTGAEIGSRFGVSAATGRRWKKNAMARLSERELATAA